MMNDGMLQLQMVVPSLKADASLTANLKKHEDVVMDLETIVHLSEISYQQKASLKYGNCASSHQYRRQLHGFSHLRVFWIFSPDNDKLEVELKSDLNSETQKMIPNVEDHRRQLQQLIDEILDQRVAKTDMKLRHIITKGIEVS